LGVHHTTAASRTSEAGSPSGEPAITRRRVRLLSAVVLRPRA
jgi:hypothetical protein